VIQEAVMVRSRGLLLFWCSETSCCIIPPTTAELAR
jgi:hypothetical protein